MAKLVVMRIIGDFNEGFHVHLNIGEEGKPSNYIEDGKLSSDELKTLKKNYKRWEQEYRKMIPDSRISVTEISSTSAKEISQLGDVIIENFEKCLKLDNFSKVRERILKYLNHDNRFSDEATFVIQTNNLNIKKLPWHLLDLFKEYPNANCIFTPTKNFPLCSDQKLLSFQSERIKILVVLDQRNKDLNLEEDLKIIKNHVQGNIEIILKNIDDIDEYLKNNTVDIFYYGGHNNGQIAFNFKNLKNVFKQAVQEGLKLALFNTCEGLNIAQALEESCIPHMIVMREPIPDMAAHRFLNTFLRQLFQDKSTSIHSALKKATEDLSSLGNQNCPCADWLPMIIQSSINIPTDSFIHNIPGQRDDGEEIPATINKDIIEDKYTNNKTGLHINLNTVAIFMLLGLMIYSWLQILEERKNLDEIIQSKVQATVEGMSQDTDPELINIKTKSSIIKIKSSQSNSNIFSGVIIGEKIVNSNKNKYYALTIKENINVQNQYKIIHEAQRLKVKIEHNFDDINLSIISFVANDSYHFQALIIKQQSSLLEGTPIYLAGMGIADGSSQATYYLHKAQISAIDHTLSEGHSLIYAVDVRSQMEGGA